MMYTTIASNKNYRLLKMKLLELLIATLTILLEPIKSLSGRVFSPEISPKTIATPVKVTATESTAEAQGKEKMMDLPRQRWLKKLQVKTPLDKSWKRY